MCLKKQFVAKENLKFKMVQFWQFGSGFIITSRLTGAATWVASSAAIWVIREKAAVKEAAKRKMVWSKYI